MRRHVLLPSSQSAKYISSAIHQRYAHLTILLQNTLASEFFLGLIGIPFLLDLYHRRGEDNNPSHSIMWALALVRNSGRRYIQVSTFGLRGTFACVDTGSRDFSSDDNSRRPPSQGGRGGGRDGGRGYQGRGPHQNQRGRGGGRGNPKTSFSERFYEPAERGELVKHRSTVPRTAGKKPKGHAVRGADAPFPKEEEEELEVFRTDDAQDYTLERETKPAQKTGSMAKNSPIEDIPQEERALIDEFIRDYRALISSDEEEKYYWNERDFDGAEEAMKDKLFAELNEKATLDDDENPMVEVDDETFAMFDAAQAETQQVEQKAPPQRQFMSPADDPVFQFVPEAMQIEGLDKPPPADYDRVLPLQLSGPTIYDFVESMMHHPSKYGEVRWEAPNEERDREPFAKLPPGRLNPPQEFVESHKRFIYVWGLPPLLTGEKEADVDNPLHCVEIQKVVGSCFDVPLEQVSVATSSSAFIGFNDINDQKFCVTVGPMAKSIESAVVISQYSPGSDFELATKYPDSLVLLDNLPLGLSPDILATSLFPAETEVGEVYGSLTAERITMLSPTSAVVALDSAEMAENAIASILVKERLTEIGQHQIRYAKARRELIPTGTHGGPDGTDPLRKLGPRLVVDGDMPTKAFFTSHANTIFLRDLDPSVTKEQISEFFQPFCAVARDVEGSTEYVTCRDGLPTGRAFVGFDELGEAETALEALCAEKGVLTGLGPSMVVADFVHEKTRKTQKRPARSEDELLHSLNTWQDYVDPEDLEELLDHNISIESLDETFRAIRYHNSTFASMDQAMRNETLNPDKDSGGMFKELVQTYIATLKECLSTPENPGAIYESIHFPDEPFDTEIFDEEPARQEELRKRREVP